MLRKFIVVGACLTVGGPALGFLGTVIGMIRGFATLGNSGISNPDALSSEIGVSLYATVIGITIGIIGFVMFAASMITWWCTRSKESPPPLNS